MALKPSRVFLSLQPVGYKKSAGADPFTYGELWDLEAPPDYLIGGLL
jgi:hypothetical protein